MNYTLRLIPVLLATTLLGACSVINTGTTSSLRAEPTYEEAANSKFVQANQQAVNQLIAGLDLAQTSGAPMLVATIVNVNDLRRAAPLGRTLSEQYASHMVNRGFNVKEVKLRGDVFVREETGELLLSREVKEIARVHSAALVLVGTYSTAAQFTYVSLKIVRTDSGQILRGYDYALPNDVDVTKLLQVSK